MASENNGLVRSYFYRHEVQRPYHFLAQFLNYEENISVNKYQIKSVTLPSFAFKKESVKVGGVIPQVFAVLDSDGLEMKMEFEEDTTGKVSQFIAYIQSRIFSKSGYHRSVNKSKIGDIHIRVYDNVGDPVMDYVAKNCVYLKAEEVKFSYSENQAISYTVTFAFDYYEIEYFKEPTLRTEDMNLAISTPDRLPQSNNLTGAPKTPTQKTS